jgi:hypothetical protein
VREIVGFAAGITAGVAGTLLMGSEAGRRLRERLVSEAEPDIRTAMEEWDPLLREVARAVRLAARDLEDVVDRASRYVSSLTADEPPVVSPTGDGPGARDDGSSGPRSEDADQTSEVG